MDPGRCFASDELLTKRREASGGLSIPPPMSLLLTERWRQMPHKQYGVQKRLLQSADARRVARPKSGPVGPIWWRDQTEAEWKAMLVLGFWMTLIALVVLVVVFATISELAR